MKSDFEKNAAREAVEAVERRYERNQRAARLMRGRRRFGRLAIAALVVAAGVWLWRTFLVGGFSDVPALSDLSSLVGGSDSLSGSRREYGEALRILLGDGVKLSSEMPEALKIKKAEAGERYVVLTPPAGDWFGLYELTRMPGDVAVNELSPVASPRQVKAAALQAACAGKPYLVAVRGQVYLFGSTDPKDAERLRNRVRALVGTDRERKE